MGQQVILSETGVLVTPNGQEIDLSAQTGAEVTSILIPGDLFHAPTKGYWSPSVPRTYQKLISGGAAGDHTVSGVDATGTALHRIVGVMHFTAGALTADLTSEFSVTATANTINNTGGTDTTGDQLLVTWQDMGNYDFGGITFPGDEVMKVAKFVSIPSSWPSIDFSVVLLAEDYSSSGTIRLCSTAIDDYDDLTMTGPLYNGPWEPPTPPSFNAGAGVNAPFKVGSIVLHRDPDNDTLAVGSVLMAMTLSKGE